MLDPAALAETQIPDSGQGQNMALTVLQVLRMPLKISNSTTAKRKGGGNLHLGRGGFHSLVGRAEVGHILHHLPPVLRDLAPELLRCGFRVSVYLWGFNDLC